MVYPQVAEILTGTGGDRGLVSNDVTCCRVNWRGDSDRWVVERENFLHDGVEESLRNDDELFAEAADGSIGDLGWAQDYVRGNKGFLSISYPAEVTR